MANYIAVPRELDDQLEALLAFIAQNGWTITGVDADQLKADLQGVRADRLRQLDLDREAADHRQRFQAELAERYGRYMKTLEVLRAANRDDPAMLRALEAFKRRRRRAPAASPVDETETAT